MTEWFWPEQDILKILFFIFLLFTLLSLFFVLLTLLIRIYHTREEKRQDKMTRHFNEIFFAYLDRPQDKALLWRMQSLKDKEEFFKFLLHYLQILKGKENELILALLKKIDLSKTLRVSLLHRNKWKRAYSAYALGILGDERSVEPLLRACNDPFYLVRFYANQALIRMRHQKSLKQSLINLFQIPYLSSYQVMEGFVDIHPDDLGICRELLREMKNLTEYQVKIFVDLFSFKRYSEAAMDIYEILSTAQSLELKISCIRALGLMHYTPAVQTLRRLLKDDDWVIKSQSMRSLGRIGDIGSLADFRDLLQSGNFWVKYNAALALFDLGEIGHEYLIKIRQDPQHPGQEIAEQILFEKKVFFQKSAGGF